MDIEIIETGNGGDYVMTGAVRHTVSGYENMPYLAMFGGTDFWANDLLFANIPGGQVASKTEAALKSNALSSSGRVAIEQAIKEDLQFLIDNIPGTTIDVQTGISDPRTWQCRITINGDTFYMNFNPGSDYLNYKV